MNKSDQISFVNELCMRMALDIATKIDAGAVPEEWDGHELRCLVADKANANASRSEILTHKRGTRARSYRNHIITTNIL